MTKVKSTYLTLLAALPLLLALAPMAVQAIPSTFIFSTDSTPALGSNSVLAALLDGSPVTGTFDYDPDALATGTLPGGPFVGATAYAGGISNLSGSIGGSSFFDPSGSAIVGNEPLPTDIFLLAGDPLGVIGDFSGFALAGFTLVNVRMFWLEGQPGIGDFLADQNLLAQPPTLSGRLALDFGPGPFPGVPTSVFFDGLTVRQVPEPGTLALLGLGLAGMGLARRRKKV